MTHAASGSDRKHNWLKMNREDLGFSVSRAGLQGLEVGSDQSDKIQPNI